MKILENRVAVITGAASGLGREFALLGAHYGLKMVLADVQDDALEQTRSQVAEQGAQVIALHCDVRDANQVQALADAAMKTWGAVHLVFNNAGVAMGGLVWENSVADWEWVLGVNLWGVIHGVRIFTPLMLECARQDPHYEGHIINTASMAGLVNAPAMGPYNVSKHAVVSLSESLYHDLQLVDAPIMASVLCPYFVPTAITQSDRNRTDTPGEATPSQKAALSLIEKAVASGKVSASDVAGFTFDAIKHGQFYIYSHPHALANVEIRMREIVNHINPSDPYQATPKISELLRAKLKAGN
jgi:NAD(P)-dependent dehydrogenase (short-subunit alcohol dehydrogenase family)